MWTSVTFAPGLSGHGCCAAQVGALTLLWLFAVYAIAFGVMLVLLALKLRSGLGRLTKAL